MPWLKRSQPTDTGWCDVSGELINGWTGLLFVRRIGRVVYFRGKLIAANATSTAAWLMPPGFNAPPLASGGQYDYGAALAWTAETSPTVRRVNYYNSRLAIVGYQPGDVVSISDCYVVDSAWPASYPGVS